MFADPRKVRKEVATKLLEDPDLCIPSRVADHRVCEIAAGPPSKARAFEAADYRSRVRVVAVVGALLLYGYCLSAVVKFNSWPVSMYPAMLCQMLPALAISWEC